MIYAVVVSPADECEGSLLAGLGASLLRSLTG